MICKCGFKHHEPACPICGTQVVKVEKKPKRLKQRSVSKRNMAEFFRDYVRHRYPGYVAGMGVRCDNCKLPLWNLNYSNMSHIQTRGARPGKAYDFKNMAIHCCSLDFMGQEDISCHTMWEQNKIKDFEAVEGMRRDWEKSAGGMWIPTGH